VAANYTNLATREEVEYVGGTQTRNVVAVSAISKPHGVYFEFRIPRADLATHQPATLAEAYGGVVEDIFKNPNAVGAEWAQTVNAAGLLQDEMVIYVQSDSGNSSASFTLSFYALDPARVSGLVDALAAQLNALEAT